MNLYLLTQNKVRGYDTYDSVVVAAKSAADAKTINPCGDWEYNSGSWCKKPADVDALFLGKAAKGIERGVVLASFKAG